MKCMHCGRTVPGQYCHHCGKAAGKTIMTKRAKIGCALIAAPWVGLVSLLLLYAIVSALFAPTDEQTLRFVEPVFPESSTTLDATPLTEAPTLRGTVGRAVSTGLGLLGMLFMVSIFVCTPIGAYLMLTAHKGEKA